MPLPSYRHDIDGCTWNGKIIHNFRYETFDIFSDCITERMTRAVKFTRHSNKTWGNIAGPRTLIASTCWIWRLKHFFWVLNVRNSTFNSNSGDTPQLLHNSRAYFHRVVTLPFALTHFTFVLDFRRLITSVSGCNLWFSSTLKLWIEYLSCNDELVSKIRDHFPNVNYLKSPNGERFWFYNRTLSEKLLCTMFQVMPTWLAILINAEINCQLFLLNKTYRVYVSNFTRL